ncbi:MAG: proteasome assembly chaperone family protein [Methanobacteriaceae archaeon]|nr:proteasome assembly chaperone family protein [Methanobacteriaceae archaeon]
MNKTIINQFKDVDLDEPIFIEALPGIGHVGKLVAEHLIHELEAEKLAELYSPSFPPQVFVGENGIIEPMKNEFYYLKSAGEDKKDYIILVGNTQGLSPEGQYEICGAIIDFVKKYGVKEMYTLGGLGTGQPVDSPKVFGAATNIELAENLKQYEVTLRSADGGIIGASGLLLGLGMAENIEGACLMGETPGYFIDADASKAVLNVLLQILKLDVDVAKLEERAEETRKMISKAQQMEREIAEGMRLAPGEEDLRYIG